MVTVQPHSINLYVSRNTNSSLPHGIGCRYYLSWEDALWHLIEAKQIPHGSIALVPSFWCGDVISNMEKHGIHCVDYPVDESFQTPEEKLVSAIQQHNPQIIIIFHTVGIGNRLLNESTDWIRTVPSETILVEDSVHSIINPRKVSIRRANHFIIDSWRKVMPLQGSTLYGRIDEIGNIPQLPYRLSLYTLFILFWWFVMQATLWIQLKTSRLLSRFAGRIAEMSMLAGYNLIGDSSHAHPTPGYFISLYHKIDHEKIARLKERQVDLYDSQLSKALAQTNDIRPIWRRDSDRGYMRGYPIGLRPPQADTILNAIRRHGLFVRFELNDSQWSKDQKVIFLPLGPHISETEAMHIAELVKKVLLGAR